MKYGRLISFAAVAVGAVSAAHATVLFDQTPDTAAALGEYTWENQSNSQNFADMVYLNQAATATDFDLFTTTDPSTYADVQVQLWSDSSGTPGTLLSSEVVTGTNYFVYGTYSGQTVYEIDATLSTPWALNANTTYWAGASGYGYDIGQVSLVGSTNPYADGKMAQFSGESYGFMTSVGDQAFALEGKFAPTPEPASMAALGLGIFGLIARKRRK